MLSLRLRWSWMCTLVFVASCSPSTTPGTPATGSPAPEVASAPNAAAAPSAPATSSTVAAPAAASSGDASPPAMSADEKAKAAAEDIAAGRLSHHPFKWELQTFVFPAICKKFSQGWTGDGVILIKDGKVVSLDAGDAEQMTPFPGLNGKAAPAIPPELAPLFKKAVDFSVAC